MNKIKLIGFLGFLGLLAIPTKNYGFLGFFGFFSFFAAAQRQDERLSMNAYKSGFNAFVAGLIGHSIMVTALSLAVPLAMFSLLLAAVFIVVIVTFVVSMLVLEKRG